MLVSTTSTLDGYAVDEYLGPVSAHLVIGTGVLTDFFSGFSDFLGARSASYRNKIREIEGEALALLEIEAQQKRANAVIGLRVDHDEISGAGKSMMMVTAMGTAVRVRRTIPVEVQEDSHPGYVSSAALVDEIMRSRLLTDADDGSIIFSNRTWEALVDLKLAAAAPAVLREVAKCQASAGTPTHDLLAQNARRFFQVIPLEEASRHLYDGLIAMTGARSLIRDLIVELGYVDYGRVLEYLSASDRAVAGWAMQTLRGHPAHYSRADITPIEQLIILLTRVFQPAPITEKPKAFSARVKQVWTCHCGTEVSGEADRCSHCQRDRWGFLQNELSPPDVGMMLAVRVAALKRTLGGNAEESEHEVEGTGSEEAVRHEGPLVE